MDPRIRLLALVVALTIVFHETLSKVPFGISFALFVLAYLLVFQAATRWEQSWSNRWATFFLLPVLASLCGAGWYASSALQVLTWIITCPALILFSYWTTAETRSWRELFSLTPSPLFRETVFPFKNFRQHVTLPTRLSGRHAWQIILGLAVGFPLLWVITSLFSAADSTFARLVETIFQWNILPTNVGTWVLDLLVGCFFVGFIGTAIRRRQQIKIVEPKPESPSSFKDTLALHTFLVALNGIFLIFVVIQGLYLLQGSGHWIDTGLTYADYAKQSFYQLFWVGVIVFGIACACYRIAGIRERVTRILLLTLMAQTGVVLLSAGTRLSLYVSAYNLTLARWWGGIGLLFVAYLLCWCAYCFTRRTNIQRFGQGLIVGTFLLSIPLVLVNHEGRVTEYNINRFLKNETNKLDASYLIDLSSDAVPALTALAYRTWIFAPDFQLRAHGRCLTEETDLVCLRRELEVKRQALQQSSEHDWRLLTRSDWYALQLLSEKR